MENETVETVETVETADVTWPAPVRKAFDFIRKEMIVRGILCALFGILLLCRPIRTIQVLTIVVGILIVADGVSLLFSSFRCQGKKKIFAIIGSILVILLGIFTYLNPLLVDLFWIIMFGIWQIFSGVQCLCFVRQEMKFPILSGILSLIAGALLISAPLVSGVALLWISGVVLLVNGIFAVITGIRLKALLK